MKVKQLIELLEECDDEMDIDVFNRENGQTEPILRIEQNCNTILIITEMFLPF